MNGHASQCGWHCDQYPNECDCGLLRPATIGWAQTEVSAAEMAAAAASARLSAAQHRLAQMIEFDQ